jgi:hypothetical protein
MASLPKIVSAEAETRRSRSTRDDAATRAHLEAYMQAFLGTANELVPGIEEAAIEGLLNKESHK